MFPVETIITILIKQTTMNAPTSNDTKFPYEICLKNNVQNIIQNVYCTKPITHVSSCDFINIHTQRSREVH